MSDNPTLVERLRNPYGIAAKERRHQELDAADRIEALERELVERTRERDESDAVIGYALGVGYDLLDRPENYSRFKSNAIERRRAILRVQKDKP